MSLLRAVLLASVLCLAFTTFTDARITSRHTGALNSRLTREQLSMQSLGDIQPQWLTQKLDHQNLISNVTFQQKYYVNDTCMATPQQGQPTNVFLMIGGEGPVSPHYVTDHFITSQLACENNALLVALEHRFYGSSVPANDSSTQNLQFLSSSQALEDLVTFREQIMQQYNLELATFVVFGGSYSGSMSAWARLKYPQLFYGSFAASAPIRAELNFVEYFEVVNQVPCASDIAAATQAIEQMVQESGNWSSVVQMFNLCAAPVTVDDIANTYDSFSGGISGIVQYSNDNNKYQVYDVAAMCAKFDAAATPLAGLLQVWNDVNTFNGQNTCTDISYNDYIQSMQGTSDGRSWTWQTCTEFGYFQTGQSQNQPFSSSITLQYFLDQCADIFSVPGLTPNIEWINDFYGGANIVTSNTVFTNGDVDPWHILGNTQSYPQPYPLSGAGSLNLIMTDTAHCADMYPPRASDAPDLVATRAQQSQQLQQWLADAAADPIPPAKIRIAME